MRPLNNCAAPKENKYYRAGTIPTSSRPQRRSRQPELLDVPFSSYRRHLKSGMARIAEILWMAEAGG